MVAPERVSQRRKPFFRTLRRPLTLKLTMRTARRVPLARPRRQASGRAGTVLGTCRHRARSGRSKPFSDRDRSKDRSWLLPLGGISGGWGSWERFSDRDRSKDRSWLLHPYRDRFNDRSWERFSDRDRSKDRSWLLPPHRDRSKDRSWLLPPHRDRSKNRSWERFSDRDRSKDRSWLLPPHRDRSKDRSWQRFLDRDRSKDRSWLLHPHRDRSKDRSWLLPPYRDRFNDRSWLPLAKGLPGSDPQPGLGINQGRAPQSRRRSEAERGLWAFVQRLPSCGCCYCDTPEPTRRIAHSGGVLLESAPCRMNPSSRARRWTPFAPR
jgi:hypothetical protein